MLEKGNINKIYLEDLEVAVACQKCYKFAVALYPDSTHSYKDKTNIIMKRAHQMRSA